MPDQTMRTNPHSSERIEPATDGEYQSKHRPGEGVTVVPDTGKRGSRPKTDPSPYPPRPTPPPDTDQAFTNGH